MLENVHDVQVSQTSRFSLGGKVIPSVVVRYFVGDHGPFEDNYPESEVTPEAIQQGYAKRVLTLHAAGAALPNPPEETAPGSNEYRITGTPRGSVGPIIVPPGHAPVVFTDQGTVRVPPRPPVMPRTPGR